MHKRAWEPLTYYLKAIFTNSYSFESNILEKLLLWTRPLERQVVALKVSLSKPENGEKEKLFFISFLKWNKDSKNNQIGLLLK